MDSLQEALDIFDMNCKVKASAQADMEIKAALFYVLDNLSAIHPHDNCRFCLQQQTTTATQDTGEIDETNLFHWLMDNHSESKQVIVERLRRDFVITKKQA